MSFNGISQFAAVLGIMQDTRHVLLGSDNQDIRLGQLLDEAKDCIKDRFAEETLIESPRGGGTPDPDPGERGRHDESDRRRASRPLGKSKDGRALRSIANTAHDLHPEASRAMHAIADHLDRREAFMETVAASMKAIDEGETEPIQKTINSLESE